ncbi:MAG: DMT family transporter [Gemmatimonadaceae bacterium]
MTRAAGVPKGLRYMALGAFWFSVMSLLVRMTGERIPSMEIVLARGFITLALSLLAVKRAGIAPVLGNNRRLLLVRGLLGATALSCFFFSLTHLPLGEATLIQYTNPVFASLVAAYVFGERVHGADLLALLASLIGVILIARPAFLFPAQDVSLDPRHVAIALLGAFCSGTAYATIRRMTTERAEVIVLYLPLMTIPISVPFAASTWVTPTPLEWLMLLGIGITTQTAQTFMTRGLQLERTARATTVGYLQIVFAVIWGALALNERPSGWTLVGAIVIVGSTLGVAWLRRIVGAGDE